MWWRRWVSPVVGSTAMPGTFRALCERCMPRLDGDFLFCWTAMAGSWNACAAGKRQRLVGLVDACRQVAQPHGCGGPGGAKPTIIAQVPSGASAGCLELPEDSERVLPLRFRGLEAGVDGGHFQG